MQISAQPSRSEGQSAASPSASFGERTTVLFCSIILSVGTVSYYIIFQFRLYYFALILILAIVFFTRKGKISDLRPIFPLLIFEIYQAASSFWSPIARDGLSQSALDLVWVLFALIPFTYPKLKHDQLSMSLVKWYGISMLCCILYNKIMIDALIDTDKGSFRSVFGAALLVALPPLSGDSLLKRSKLSFVLLIVTVIVGFMIESRLFTIFSIPAVISSVLICRVKDRKSLFNLIPVLATLALGLFVILYATGNLENILKYDRLGASHTSFALGDTVFSEANAQHGNYVDIERRLVTQVAIDSFDHSPIFGAGYMSTSYYVGELTHYDTSAHGLLTGLMAETGIVGTLLFVIVCILTTKGYRARWRACVPEEKRWICLELLTFIAALVAGLFHQANHDFYLYLMIGGGLAGRRLKTALLGNEPTFGRPGPNF